MFQIDSSKFEAFLEIEKQRQLAMIEVSQMLGIDVTFSNDEVMKNAEESFVKYVNKEVSEWMKSALS